MVHHSTNWFILKKLSMRYLIENFGRLIQQVTENIDILTILQTKLGSNIRVSQCLTDGYSSLFRTDCNIHGVGVML